MAEFSIDIYAGRDAGAPPRQATERSEPLSDVPSREFLRAGTLKELREAPTTKAHADLVQSARWSAGIPAGFWNVKRSNPKNSPATRD